MKTLKDSPLVPPAGLFFGLLFLIHLKIELSIVEPSDESLDEAFSLLYNHPIITRCHSPDICAEKYDHPEQPSHISQTTQSIFYLPPK